MNIDPPTMGAQICGQCGYVKKSGGTCFYCAGKKNGAVETRAAIVAGLIRRAEELYGALDDRRARFYSVIAQEIECGDYSNPTSKTNERVCRDQSVTVTVPLRAEPIMVDKKQPSDNSRAAADKLVLAITNHFGDVAKFYVPSICAKAAVALDESAFTARAEILSALKEPTDDLIKAAMRAAGTPDQVLNNQDACNEMREAIRAIGKFIVMGE